MRKVLVTDYMDETAIKYSEKVAYCDEKKTVTFRTLRMNALHIATEICNRMFFQKPIVIYLEKSVECMSSFFGVAYSGNFYIPIDITMPSARVIKIKESLQPSLVITDYAHCDSACELFGEDIVANYEDIVKNQVNEDLVDGYRSRIIDTDILYVLFTSGSTGTPKGVTIPHRAVIDYIEWFVEEFHLSSGDSIGNQAPLHFDLSIQDVFAPIVTGCSVHLLPKRFFSFPMELMKYLVENKINIIMWVPSALCSVANLKGLRATELPNLRLVLFCGEVMPNKQLNMWRHAFPKTTFVNLYGPSEACDASTFYVVDREFGDDESLPIGKPCGNTGVILLDDEDKIIEKGNTEDTGEICIRGSSLALGYYGDIEKTEESFVQNPCNKICNDMLYRTGDLAHYNGYGELMYVGRKDFQIKHMGHRIELGEIEAAISSIKGIEENCCLYDEKHNRITLFYAGSTDERDLIDTLRKRLPDYMIPGKKIYLEKLPHNINGKIDRQRIMKEYL